MILHDIWCYRKFISTSIRNDLFTRFARSKLGGLWMIVNPLSQVAIYALILSNVLAAKLPGIDNKYSYAIYIMSGLLAWTLFNEILSRCLNMFIEQANLIKKMRFPRITLPIIVVGSSLLNNVLLFLSMLVIFFMLGHLFTKEILFLPAIIILLASFSAGIGILLGIFNVFVRDIGQVVPIIMQVLFWFTPIVYPITIIPEKYQYLLMLNPIYYFTKSYQDIILYGKFPDLTNLMIIFTLTIGFLILSLIVFRKASAEIVDVL